MKASLILWGLVTLISATSLACPSSNSTMQVVEGDRNGQKFCAIRATDRTKPAQILTDTKFRADTLYVLGSGLYVGENDLVLDPSQKIKLEIEAGTRIISQSESSYIQINRGAMILANGTASAPIVMTTQKPSGRTRGSWGGLIINGNAPVNGCSDDVEVCELKGEGLTTYFYGGPNPQDNSGVLKYVVVEFAGNEITPDNELNGIAFQGVGSATEVDFIQVHMNADDGVEFFGGTVNVKHVVLTGNKDDSIDWVHGWTGSAQYVIVDQFSDAGNNGIEADNFDERQDAGPRSNPTLANITLIGSDKAEGAKGGSGVLLRFGTGASIYNTYVTGFSKSCLDIDNLETFNVAEEGGIVFENVYFNCEESFTGVEVANEDTGATEPWAIENFVMTQVGNQITDLGLEGYTPASNESSVTSVEIPGLDNTDFVGAVKDASDVWYKGWIQTSKN